MAKSKTRKNKGPGGAAKNVQSRMLFAQLEREYADATPAQWEELRQHMLGRLEVLAAGNDTKRAQLTDEFNTVRDRALAGQHARQMRQALAAGKAELVRDRGDGLEEWTVPAGETSVSLFVPVASEDKGLSVAREALLAGRCPSCRLSIDLVDGFGEISHNPLCPAASALEA